MNSIKNFKLLRYSLVIEIWPEWLKTWWKRIPWATWPKQQQLKQQLKPQLKPPPPHQQQQQSQPLPQLSLQPHQQPLPQQPPFTPY